MKRALALVVTAGIAANAPAQNIGPSTAAPPYLVPNPALAGSVSTTSIFTVGDTVAGYRMVGIPDGLGAMNNPGSDTFTLLMNHELGGGSGIVRAHGSVGAFVSRWTIRQDLTVVAGRDHMTAPTDLYTWNGSAWVPGTSAFSRFCSADVPDPSAFRFGALGTDARIHMSGEEAGGEGRAFAHIVTGAAVNQTWQLPALGRFSWENAVPCPYPQVKTLVMGLDDSAPDGQVYLYIGMKTDVGNDIERAGLANGNLYGIRVQGVPLEQRAAPIPTGTRFDLCSFGDVRNMTGAAINAASNANGVTTWLRPEDGAWDPRSGRQNDFYFVTTDRFSTPASVGRSRLWRLRFDDITDPLAGGTVAAMLDGTEGQQMFDNIGVDSHGRIILQEDPGAQAYVAGVWLYDISLRAFIRVAAHNPDMFVQGAPNFLTIDEESSGVIDAKDILGDGWFLLDVQAHYSIPGELVEGGQLLAMYVDPQFVPPAACAADCDRDGMLTLADFGCFQTKFALGCP
jgi:hypothetical protein